MGILETAKGYYTWAKLRYFGPSSNISSRYITRELSFERDPNGSWYAVIPEWKGPRGALLMVAGADTVLERLANGNDFITLVVSNDHRTYEVWARRQTTYIAKAISNSGDYHIDILDMNIWLCGVNTFVWGNHPEYIYFIKKED